MNQERLSVTDYDGHGVELVPTSSSLQELRKEIVQPRIEASPVPKAYDKLVKEKMLFKYPHKGPNYLKEIQGSLACYVTAANTMHACCNEYPSPNNLIFKNNTESPAFIAKNFLDKYILDNTLPIATVIWLKGDLKIDDEKSMNLNAKNHWIILAGFGQNKRGEKIPLYLDQGSMGSNKPRPIEQILGNDRYVHEIYAPKTLYKKSIA